MREGGGRGSAPFVMRVGVIWVECGGVALCLRWGLPGRGLFSACPVGTIAQSLAAGLPYGWGVAPAGEPLFLLRGVFYLAVGFLPARLGPKPLFLLLAKEKAVLDSEKEKVDRWK